MKMPRISESKIFQTSKEEEPGVPVSELCREHGYRLRQAARHNAEMMLRRLVLTLVTLLASAVACADDKQFAGIVSSASPEATAAGVTILERGGNAIDAAVAVSLALGVTEPAGSGIAGQTTIILKRPGEFARVIQGTTWSPRAIPESVTEYLLSRGHTAASVPSTLRVLDKAHREFGSGKLTWQDLVQPAIGYAEHGFVVGPFRERSFRRYGAALREHAATASIFVRPDGADYAVGDRLRQPLLAKTLQRIADHGAMDFYQGDIARKIAEDMQANSGWITLDDLEQFPEPQVVDAIRSDYRGYTVETLPPPFAGWVVLRILEELEQAPAPSVSEDGDERRLALIDALRTGHGVRRTSPVTDNLDYAEQVEQRIQAGETTHFSIVDGDGMAVAVTQSIDSYFGAKVVHPELGFLYNNYMQGFQVDDPSGFRYLAELEMPLSSMSATIVSRNAAPLLVLGSPGSARIISAVAQVSSYWIDVAAGIEQAVAAYRVHVVPDDQAYVEGPELSPRLLHGLAQRDLRLIRPAFGVSDGQLDPYFGGVHALAFENGAWTGAADPRRDGTVESARR